MQTIPAQVSALDRALFISAGILNIVAAVGFVMPDSIFWRMTRMAMPEQTLYLHLFAGMVGLFGILYFWVAMQPADKRPLIAVAAIGKTAAFVTVFVHFLMASANVLFVLLMSADLLFAGLFVQYLRRRPAAPEVVAVPAPAVHASDGSATAAQTSPPA